MSFNCDPNFYDEDRLFAIVKGPHASSKRCLYHKTIFEYAAQYAESFFDKYADVPKVFTMSVMEGHDVIGGTIKYIDNPIVTMFNNLQKKGHLQETVILLVSDHGQHRSLVSLDHYHPLLFVKVPEKINKLYRDKIRMNQQTLVSAFNVYHFLMHLVVGEEYQYKQKGLFGNFSQQKDCASARVPLLDQHSQQNCICL